MEERHNRPTTTIIDVARRDIDLIVKEPVNGDKPPSEVRVTVAGVYHSPILLDRPVGAGGLEYESPRGNNERSCNLDAHALQ